ncbi:MAG: hypothetical protein ACRDT1_17105, partial [Micromonosporaceae bacterium]
MFSLLLRRWPLTAGTALLLACSFWLAPTVDAGTSGYRHLGAVSVEPWTGVQGRFQVRDPGVRAGTYDFVAARFMVKQPLDDGGVAWLEAGWSENGWRAGGEQVVYTYDSATHRWTFHEQYPIREGDRIWIHLESVPADHAEVPADHAEVPAMPVGAQQDRIAPESRPETVPVTSEPAALTVPAAPGSHGAQENRAADGASAQGQQWTASLWWAGQWRELTTVTLPAGGQAQVEQVVEVYVDPAHTGGEVSVPTVEVDNVRLRDAAGRLEQWWEQGTATVGDEDGSGYCVSWA